MRGVWLSGLFASAPSSILVCLVLMHPRRNGIRVDSRWTRPPLRSGLVSGLSHPWAALTTVKRKRKKKF